MEAWISKMVPIGTRTHEFTAKMREAYFEIEKRTHDGKEALSLDQVRAILGLKSKSATRRYLEVLEKAGLVRHDKGIVWAITTYGNQYPPVQWGQKLIQKENEHGS